MNRTIRKNIGDSFIYFGLSILMAIFLFPIYWMVVSSFRDNAVLMSNPPHFTPGGGNIRNYIEVLTNPKYLVFFKNSIIVAGSAVVFSILVSIFASYAFSRFSFKFKNALMTSFVSIQIFPVTVIIIPLYTFYATMKMIDTYQGLILADIVYSLPFTVWFLKAFFDTVPRSLDESAYIDGCGRLRTLLEIVAPLVKPGILAVGVYTFLTSWDDYLFALTLTKSNEMKTLTVGISHSFVGEFANDYAGMMTLSVLASLPVIIAFVFMQKYMIAGLTSGAVKG